MAKYIFGLDVGGMSVKIGLFKDEQLVEKFRIKTSTDNNGKEILPDIVKELKWIISEKEIDKEDILGIGVGVPGAIIDQGIAMQAVNLGWERTDVKGYLEEKLNIKTLVANDANLAALGEMWKVDIDDDNLVFVTLGTGVGGGIIINGKILEGSTGSGGEIGHFPIVDEDLPWTCGCGNRRCVEQLCSAQGLVNLSKHLLNEKDVESKLRDIKDYEAKDILDLAKEGDKFALEVVDLHAKYMGKALATIASIINPSYFMIGGGLSEAGSFLLDKYEKEYRKQAFSGASNAKILKRMLGNDAGIYGAAKLILG